MLLILYNCSLDHFPFHSRRKPLICDVKNLFDLFSHASIWRTKKSVWIFYGSIKLFASNEAFFSFPVSHFQSLFIFGFNLTLFVVYFAIDMFQEMTKHIKSLMGAQRTRLNKKDTTSSFWMHNDIGAGRLIMIGF